MATTYRATITFNVWKQHTCVNCNGRYRYLLTRKMTGRGATERAASAAAEANVLRALTTEVDQHPCPTCGLYQPDMVGERRGDVHLLVFLGYLAACLIPIVTGFATSWAWYVPWLTAALASIALLFHLLVDARNPNRQPEANLDIARRSVEGGVVYLTEAGDAQAATNGAPGSAWRPAGQMVLYGLFLLGVLLLPMGEMMRLVHGWPNNPEWRPHVVGPGDKPYIYFPSKISSVKGYWSATGKAVVLNGDEGMPRELKLTSNTTTWGDTISVKDNETNSSSTLYAYVQVPDDPQLAGKTLKIKMDLEILYPKLQGDKFGDAQQTATYTADLIIAKESKAGTTYLSWYWLGLAGGLLVTLGASLAVMKRASSVRALALPTEIHTPDKDLDTGRAPKRSGDQIQD